MGGERMYLKNSELQYDLRNSEKKVLIEEFLDNGDGESPEDFKVYCYDGKPLYFLVCRNRQKAVKLIISILIQIGIFTI